MTRRLLVGPHYWGVFGPGGWLIPSTVRILRREAVEAALEGCPWGWAKLRDGGWRVAKIFIVPCED